MPSSKDSDSLNTRANRNEPNQPARTVAEAFGYEVPATSAHLDAAADEHSGQFFAHGPKAYTRSDQEIRGEIGQRLKAHPDIDASHVEIEVHSGIVRLSGTVDDRHEKRLAEFISEDAIGVDDVDNRLKIRHGFWSSLISDTTAHREPQAP